jgi:hypothetical protein
MKKLKVESLFLICMKRNYDFNMISMITMISNHKNQNNHSKIIVKNQKYETKSNYIEHRCKWMILIHIYYCTKPPLSKYETAVFECKT